MTPQRKAYFEKCSKWETELRCWIKQEKAEIKKRKWCLNLCHVDYDRRKLKEAKKFLNMYCHELARLKGMDRVVVPYEQYDRRFETYSWHCTKCDSEISVFQNCCSECGRRILWEKVSE